MRVLMHQRKSTHSLSHQQDKNLLMLNLRCFRFHSVDICATRPVTHVKIARGREEVILWLLEFYSVLLELET